MTTDFDKNKELESQEEVQKKHGITRRMLAGIAVGAVVAAATGGSKQASAEGPSEAQTAVNTGVLISEIKQIYQQTKEWIGDWNTFVGTFNQSMQFAKDAYTMLTQPQNNIFYQQFKQMVDYVDTQLTKGGNFLDYRLDYLYPVLFDKIDGMMLQVTNLNYRYKTLAIRSYFQDKPGADENDPTHKNDSNTKYDNSNIGKTIRRVSTDTADYGVTRAKIEAFQSVSENTKQSINNIPLNPGPPKNGEAPQKSRGQIFQELSAPASMDIQIEQLRLLNEISMKLTNLMLVMSKIGEPPIVADNEQVVSSDVVKKIINNDMAKGTSNIQADTSVLSNTSSTK